MKQAFQARSLVPGLDETGDKKGRTTDDVARQSLGKLHELDPGLVSVHADTALQGSTFLLLVEVFTPQPRVTPTLVTRPHPSEPAS
jgi:SRSO17 transposase